MMRNTLLITIPLILLISSCETEPEVEIPLAESAKLIRTEELLLQTDEAILTDYEYQEGKLSRKEYASSSLNYLETYTYAGDTLRSIRRSDPGGGSDSYQVYIPEGNHYQRYIGSDTSSLRKSRVFTFEDSDRLRIDGYHGYYVICLFDDGNMIREERFDLQTNERLGYTLLTYGPALNSLYNVMGVFSWEDKYIETDFQHFDYENTDGLLIRPGYKGSFFDFTLREDGFPESSEMFLVTDEDDTIHYKHTDYYYDR